jgi:hypothetical protein
MKQRRAQIQLWTKASKGAMLGSVGTTNIILVSSCRSIFNDSSTFFSLAKIHIKSFIFLKMKWFWNRLIFALRQIYYHFYDFFIKKTNSHDSQFFFFSNKMSDIIKHMVHNVIFLTISFHLTMLNLLLETFKKKYPYAFFLNTKPLYLILVSINYCLFIVMYYWNLLMWLEWTLKTHKERQK